MYHIVCKKEEILNGMDPVIANGLIPVILEDEAISYNNGDWRL